MRARAAGGVPRWALALVLVGWVGGDAFARGTPAPPAPKPPVPKPAAPGGSVSGTVKGEDGKPIAGAEVVAVHAASKSTFKAVTEANGAFVIRGVPAGEAVVLVRARSRVPVEKRVTVPARGAVTCDAALALGVRFAGKVTDMQGRPVAGAVVESVQTGEEGMVLASAAGTSRSGADGGFVADGLAAGTRYTIRVRHPRHAPVELPDLPAEPGAGHENLDVVMEDAAWVRGVVVDPSGKPVPTARVGVAGQRSPFGDAPVWIRVFLEDAGVELGGGGPEGGGGRVDPGGRFEVGGLVEPDTTLTAVADGYFATKWKVEGLEVGKGREDVRITLEPATAWIEGKVVDAQGRGIGGATVEARGDEGAAGEARSDAIGKFRLTKVRSRAPVTLVATAEGRAPARMKQVALNSGGLSITLHLSPRLKARLVDEAGKILPKVHLMIQSKSDGRLGFDSTSVDQTEKGIDVPLPLGDVTVRATSGRGLHAEVGSWTTEPGATVDAGTVTLARKGSKKEPEEEEEEGEGEGGEEE